MPNGVPRAQIFSNIFTIIEPGLFNRCLAARIGALHSTLKRQIIAIDGKRRRGSHGLDTEAFRESHNPTYIGHAARNLGALRRIVIDLLKIDLTDNRSLPRRRRRAMLDLTYRDSLLSRA